MTGVFERSGKSSARATVLFLSLAALFLPLADDANAQASCFIQTPVGAGNNEGVDVVIQPDGRIVVAGYSHNGANTDFTVIRYNPDLSLDTTFGVTGIAVTPVGAALDIARSVALQTDGKIVVAGQFFNGLDNDFAVVRYNPGGSADATFDFDGIVTTPIGPAGDEGFAVAIQPDGGIVVAGESDNGTDEDTVVVRYDTSGALDPTFDFDGIAFAPISPFDDYARDVALQADGKIVTAGTSWNGTDFDFAAARFDTSGSLDPSFGGGWITTSVGPGEDMAFGVAIQPDGRLVLAGWVHNGIDYDLGLARLDPAGTLDPTFDTDGLVTTPLLSGNDFGNGVALQTDDRIVVAGSTHTGLDFDHALIRYNEDGSLACGRLSLHPIANGSINTFSNLGGCPTNNWDCVNDQPGNAPTGPAATDDGLASFLEDGLAQTNREMFALLDGTIPGGARVTRLEIHGQVGTSGGPTPGFRLSYQRMGWDPVPVDGPSVGVGVACCDGAISWPVPALSWSAAELDALEIGVFHDSGGQAQVSQLYVTVTYMQTRGPRANYRSIGTAADYSVGTVAATSGLTAVTGSGTSFLAANRGRGDRIQIDSVDYTIRSVSSETVLTLMEPFAGATGFGKSYTISRQFGTIQAWEDCISAGGPCTFFPVSSSSLIADDREEKGIAYDDSVFTLLAPVLIDGSTTDSDHTITLTADPGNRHNGTPGAGVIVDGNGLPNEILVQDDEVTIEWLEIVRVRQGTDQASIHVVGPPGGPQAIRLRKLLIHDFYDAAGIMSGIRLSGGGGKEVKIRNVMIWDGDDFGIRGDNATDSVDVENVTIDNIRCRHRLGYQRFHGAEHDRYAKRRTGFLRPLFGRLVEQHLFGRYGTGHRSIDGARRRSLRRPGNRPPPEARAERCSRQRPRSLWLVHPGHRRHSPNDAVG